MYSVPMVIYLSVFLLSASGLAFEIVLSRLFSIAQFYHFAFMTVSLALLGAGASGTALTVSPALRRGDPAQRLSAFALAAALATVASWTLANWLPFDSFAIAWDGRQVLYLVSIYLALSAPFFFGALAVGWLLAARASDAPRIYAANLAGSAAGCGLALGALAVWGGEGAMVFCAWLAALASLAPMVARRLTRDSFLMGAACLAAWMALSTLLAARPAFLTLRLSPYKALSQSLRYPGSERVWSRWDASSRVDLIRSPGIRSFPGLSYAYLGPLPRQDGLTFDGDDLSPITFIGAEGAEFAGYMPGALAYQLRPGAHALILEARGGLDVMAALASGAFRVTAVEPNEIAVEAAQMADPRVQWVIEDARSFVARRDSRETFEVVQLALTSPYRPVTSGAYSLIEDYDLTVEAFGDDLARLKEGGLLVVTRWLQLPPSEPLRLLALAAQAAERARLDPARSIVALRGYNTVTVLVKRGEFTGQELEAVRAFAAARKFDLAALPGLRPDEANRYNVLPDDVFYRTFDELLSSPDRRRFYAAYPFDVTPPTDDRPFFGHYFKWAQAGEVWAQLGKTWQPFGGAGYFVLVVLLAFALVSASVLIVLPLVVRGARSGELASLHTPHSTLHALAYFAMLGLGFLFVEIPLVQRLILFVGKPAYALAVALFGLLLFSGLGSVLSSRVPWRGALVVLTVAALVYPMVLPGLFRWALGWPLTWRFLAGALSLAPLGVLMGMPFPKGMDWLRRSAPGLIPWAWGVNGAVSVVASVLASLLALSAGLTVVLVAGALCYGVALIVVRGQ